MRTVAIWRGVAALCLMGLVLLIGCRGNEGRLRIVLSADTRGFLEDCGCGPTPQGGLARRADLLRRLRTAESTPILLMDGGNLHHVVEDEPHLRAARELVSVMGRIGYDLAVLGPQDAALKAPALREMLNGASFTWLGGAYRNARPALGLDTAWVATRGGITVGVLDTADPGYGPNRLPADRVDDGLLRRARLLRPHCDLLIVAAALDPRGPEVLARELDGLVDVLLVTGAEARSMPQEMGGVWVVSVGDRGRNLGLLEVELKRGQALRRSWSLLPVDNSLIEDPHVADQIREHTQREQGLERGRRERARLVLLARLGIPSNQLPGNAALAWYQGEKDCRACHQEQWEAWRASPHAGPFALPPREDGTEDPLARRRLVTGWLEKGGWLSQEETPHLSGVQCEACHGRASMHTNTRGELREGLADDPWQSCAACHDPVPVVGDPHALRAAP